MWNEDNLAVAACHSVDPDGVCDVAPGGAPDVDPVRWQAELDGVMARIGPRFARVEPRRRAKAFLAGLMAELPRRNCWSIAEYAGQASPDGMQRLLNGAVWDEQAVLQDLRDYVVEHLGDPGAVLVVDETGGAPRGAEVPCGMRGPPLVIAVTG